MELKMNDAANVEALVLKNMPLIEKVADGNPGGQMVLIDLLIKRPETFSQTMIDLDDMLISGPQIWIVFNDWCQCNMDKFVDECKKRDHTMIDFVNAAYPDKVARAHGPQTTIPSLDGAVKQEIEKAQEEGKLVRMDEGAEAVNSFFLAMLAGMQASKVFMTNVKINLNTGNGEWGVFAVHFVELLNRDGTPVSMQPQNETKEMEGVATPSMDESGIHDALGNTNG
jgi:hypothetical protein